MHWIISIQHRTSNGFTSSASPGAAKMLSILMVIVPIFGLILLGYFCRRFEVLGPFASAELNRFVIYLALPALLFDVMAKADWHDFALLEFAGAFGLSSVIIYGLTVGLCLYKRRPLADASIDGLGSAYSNAGYIGIPLGLLVLGEESLPAVTLAAVLATFFLFAISIVLVEVGLQAERSPSRIVLRVGGALVRNPLLVAPMLGALFAVSGISMPSAATSFLTLLGDCASPCALIALGLFLADNTQTAKSMRNAALPLTVGKLVAHPVLTWFLVYPIFALPPALAKTAVLLAALPTGTGPFMLAEFYRRGTTETSGAILLSTIISLVTITLLLAYGGYGTLSFR